MEITLIMDVKGDEIHGSENERRTGCGINLLKDINITRYRRKGQMQDLKEITCEKCKSVIAQKMIKADKKERDRLLKEEKLRKKRGIEDESIVPLGNTTARITRDPNAERLEREKAEAAARAAEKAKREADERAAAIEQAAAEKAAAEREAAERSAAAPKTIPGTGIAFDQDLAQFAINIPQQTEEKAPEAAQTVQQAAGQDNFLAQFAIPNPEQPAVPTPVQPTAPVQQQPVQQSAPAENDDIMKMFSIGSDANGNEVLADSEQEESTGIYDNDSSVIDISDDDIAVDTTYDEPDEDDEDEEINSTSEWEYVANQLFGFNDAAAPSAEPVIEDISVPQPAYQSAPVMEEPVIEDISIPQPAYQSAPVMEEPVIEDISIPQPAYQSAPVMEEPVIEDISIPLPAYQSAPVMEEPVIEDISIPQPAYQSAPVMEEPVIEDISIPQPAYQSAPVIEEAVIPQPVVSEPEIPQPVYQSAPAEEAVPETPAYQPQPQKQETVIEETVIFQNQQPQQNAYQQAPVTAPFYQNTPVYQQAPVQPVQAPVYQNTPAPSTAPATANVSPANVPEPQQFNNSIGDNNMSNQKYSTPVFADEVNTQKPAVQPQTAPVQSQPADQSVITVPQFAGYDMNGQPVYNYVQMKMTGVDVNGQPVFAPITPMVPPMAAQPVQPQVQQVAPVQPQVTPVQPAVQVQPQVAPVQPSAPKPYRAPSANISKIATNPHSKPIPKSFVNALANSREQGKKNLIETQGAHQMPVLDSIEDVLTQMGDDSVAKQRQMAAQQAVPVFDEYKAPVNSFSTAQKKSAVPDRPLTKSEMKAKKKQDKIDAKFRKDLAKRGF